MTSFAINNLSIKYTELDILKNITINGGQQTEIITASPISREQFVSVDIPVRGRNELSLSFPNPISINGISFFFPGNLQSQTSFGARNIQLYYIDNNGIKQLINTRTNNTKPYYEYYSRSEIRTSEIKLTFSEPFSFQDNTGGTVRINDLKLYEKTDTNLMDGLFYNLKKYDHSIPARLFYYWEDSVMEGRPF